MIVNFFESIIRIDVRICEDQMIELVYHDRPFYRGDEYSALKTIRSLIEDLSASGERELIFNLSNHRPSSSQYEADKHRLGEEITRLRRYGRCRIIVNTGITGLFG